MRIGTGARGVAAFVAVLAGSGCGGAIFIPPSGVGVCASDAGCPLGQKCDLARGVCAITDQGPCAADNLAGYCGLGKLCKAPGVCRCVDAAYCACDGECPKDGGADFCVGCAASQGCDAHGTCVDIVGEGPLANTCSPERPSGVCEGQRACCEKGATCCLAAEVCAGDHCVPNDNPCSASLPTGWCAPGLACVGGRCEVQSECACSPSNVVGCCAPGKACTNGDCVAVDCSATVIGSCARDFVCLAGACVQLPCSPAHTGGLCSSPQFCAAAGVCLAPGDCKGSDLDCPVQDYYCSTTDKCLIDGICATDIDCEVGMAKLYGQGYRCEVDTCVARTLCVLSGDCVPTKFCTVGFNCRAAGQCDGDPDCSSSQFCSLGTNTCLALDACNSDVDCKEANHFCAGNHLCLDRTLGECAIKADCPPGNVCLPSGHCQINGAVCTTLDVTAVGCAVGELVCCPAGQTCCIWSGAIDVRARCHVGATVLLSYCIPASDGDVSRASCVDDSDCLASMKCDRYLCVPRTTSGCVGCDLATQKCSLVKAASGQLVSTCLALSDCNTTGDCGVAEYCDGHHHCGVDASCGVEEKDVGGAIQPNLMVAFDRSGSMNLCGAGDPRVGACGYNAGCCTPKLCTGFSTTCTADGDCGGALGSCTSTRCVGGSASGKGCVVVGDCPSGQCVEPCTSGAPAVCSGANPDCTAYLDAGKCNNLAVCQVCTNAFGVTGETVSDRATRYRQATGAIGQVANDFRSRIRFGVTMFPEPSGAESCPYECNWKKCTDGVNLNGGILDVAIGRERCAGDAACPARAVCLAEADCPVGGQCADGTFCMPPTACPGPSSCPASGICVDASLCEPGEKCAAVLCPDSGTCPAYATGAACDAGGACGTSLCPTNLVCPDGSSCTAGGTCPAYACRAIGDALAMSVPGGSTPTAKTLIALLNAPQRSGLGATDRANAIVLVTDGNATGDTTTALKVCQPLCSDGQKDAGETDVDCGGLCASCVDAKACTTADDCASRICRLGFCRATSCNNESKDSPPETDIDCGGACGPCADGKLCAVAADCVSGVCVGGKCAARLCSDAVKNGNETDLDCGGSCATLLTPQKCALGKGCTGAVDCLSGVCQDGTCRDVQCGNGALDTGEIAIDCSPAGGTCGMCPDGAKCLSNATCKNGLCVTTLCDGGANAGKTCLLDDCPAGSCASKLCDGGANSGGACVDVADCPGGACAARTCSGGPNAGKVCVSGSDCPWSSPLVPVACIEPARKCVGGANAGLACVVDDCPGASCADGRKCNGGSNDGLACTTGAQCPGGFCAGTCSDLCHDGVQSGHESDIDCGGAECQACLPGHACRVAGACSGGTNSGNVCTAASGCPAGAGSCDTNAPRRCLTGANVGMACSSDNDCLFDCRAASADCAGDGIANGQCKLVGGASASQQAELVNSTLDRAYAEDPRIKTFVVGFAFTSPALNCHAVRAHTVRDDVPACATLTAANCWSAAAQCYYTANNRADLEVALAGIVEKVAACAYPLTAVVSNSNLLVVFLEDTTGSTGDPPTRTRLERYTAWDFDVARNQIVFVGSACTALKAKTVRPIVVFTCPTGEY